jgi:thioredoxin
MGIDTTDNSFQAEVIAESMNRPVMVDFWAEWCGPCRMLGPVLEKLEKEYQGRFLLAKLNSDHNQATAMQYQISGIPAVKLFYQGKVADEFVGALPEPRVRAFIEKNLPDPTVEKIKTEAESDPIKAAHDLITGDAKHVPEIYWKALMAILKSDGKSTMPEMSYSDSVNALLKLLPEVGNEYSDPGRWLAFFLGTSPESADTIKVANSYGNTVSREDMEYFIKKIADTSGEQREHYRDALLVIFFNIRESKDTVNEFRRSLSSLLF